MKDADVDTIVTQNLNRSRFGFLRRRFGIIGSLVLVVFIAWSIWAWGFWRFYVGPGKMAIITAKIGETMPPGQILANSGQKGVLREVLGEGRHLWNPIYYDWKIVDALDIPLGKVGVVTSLEGDTLPPGEFLAEREGQKGTWRWVIGPGRYRLNPYGYAVEVVDAVSIPVGFSGVVTNRSGTPAPDGEFAGPGEKGMRADVLQPGFYYINPRVYDVSVVEVGVNQVSLMGQDGGVVLTKNIIADENNQLIQRLNQNVLEDQKRRREEYQQMAQNIAPPPPPSPRASAPAKTSRSRSGLEQFADEMMDDPGAPARRMMERSLPAGQVSAVTRGRAPVMEKDVAPAFILNQFVNFPSRDGFDISLDMTVEFELLPEHLAAIYRQYGDLSEVVDKIVMPQILSVSRNTGSTYRAVDFIAGEGREKFQNDLTDNLKASVGNEKVLIHSALISNVNVPGQILEPLRTTSLSKETNLTNIEKQNTAKKQADLNREMSLIKQSGEQVMQETDKMKAQIDAEMRKTVAMIQADTTRQMAAIEKETATVRASKTIALGQADATAVRIVGEEKAKGFGMKVRAFGEDGNDYALYEFAMQLNPNMTINLIHAGEGTLWTDLKNASLAEIGGAKAIKGR
jgi:hypothetical protein